MGDEDHFKYLVLIEATGEGSELLVYRYLEPGYAKKSYPNIEHKNEWRFRFSPGLHSYAGDLKQFDNDHVRKMVNEARVIVPTPKLASTPIFFYMTSGFRVLPQETQKLIAAMVCDRLLKGPFQMATCEDNIRVLSGQEEGTYRLLAANYHSGTLDGKGLYGVLNVENESAQLSIPVKSFSATSLNVIFKFSLEHPSTIHILSKSYPSLGYDSLVRELNNSRFIQKNPCYPRENEGSSNFDECLLLIDTTLNAICGENPMNCYPSTSEPLNFYNISKVMVLVQHEDVLPHALQFAHEDGFNEYLNTTKAICGSTREQLSDGTKINEEQDEQLSQACLRRVWVLAFLSHGIGFPQFHLDASKKGETIDVEIFGAQKTNEHNWAIGKAFLHANHEYASVTGGREYFDTARERILGGGGTMLGTTSSSWILLVTGILLATFFALRCHWPRTIVARLYPLIRNFPVSLC
ncbi:hypothetical protein DICA1_F15434 [Diutina catenulata]